MINLYSIAYLPPASYFYKAAKEETFMLDKHEHFVKQTYRNRCSISGPNGKQDLIIPVEHTNIHTIPISQVKIANSERWQSIHWRSILAAYRNSPYFEYYEDDFKSFYEKKYELLFEFNFELLQLLFKLKKQKPTIIFTDQFEKDVRDKTDLRNYFIPKNKIESVSNYHQVFQERNGFIEGLSIVDHLFNVR